MSLFLLYTIEILMLYVIIKPIVKDKLIKGEIYNAKNIQTITINN